MKTKAERDIEKAVKLLEKNGYTVTPPSSPVLLTDRELSEKKLQPRKDALVAQMLPYQDRYSKDMLNQFFLYWTEPNKSLTKMRFEMEKVWDISRRLATWYRNNNKHNGTDFKEQQRQQRIRESAELFARYAGSSAGDNK